MQTLNERFQQQLDEATNKPGSREVFAWIKQNAPNQYALLQSGQARFFRGVQGTHNSDKRSVIMPAPAKYRPAKNTGDMYKVLLDACNPDWPKRGRSTVVTTDPYQAGMYGTTVIIVPPDSTIVACVNKEDLHDTAVLYINLGTSNVIDIISGALDAIAHGPLKKTQLVSFAPLKKAEALAQRAMDKDETAQQLSMIQTRMMDYGHRLVDVLKEMKISQSERDKLVAKAKTHATARGEIIPTAGWVLDIVSTLTVPPFFETIKKSKFMTYEFHGCSKDPAGYDDVSGDSECWFEGPYAILQFDNDLGIPIPKG